MTKSTSELVEGSCFFGPLNRDFMKFFEAELRCDWMLYCKDLKLDWFYGATLERTFDKVETFKVVGSFNNGTLLFAMDEIWRLKRTDKSRVEQRLAVKVHRALPAWSQVRDAKCVFEILQSCFKSAWNRVMQNLAPASVDDIDPRAWLFNPPEGPQAS